VSSNVSDLIHIEMAVHRFDPSDLLGSCERVLHHTIKRVLQAIKTRYPAGAPSSGSSQPKNEGREREVHIAHIEDYGRGTLSFS
jgi:hypothetical protein